MKIPSFVWILLVLVIGFGFLFVVANSRNNQLIQEVSLPVEVAVYFDFNCPHCADFEPFVKEAREKYGEKANIELKNLPFLTSGQTRDTSVEYASAQIAARLQGKGNEFAEMLFKWLTYIRNPQNTIYTYSDSERELFTPVVNLDLLAEYLQLDVKKFSSDRISSDVNATLLAEKEEGIRLLGAPSTPSVFIYGEQLRLSSFNDLDRRIGEYIQQIESKN